MHRTPAALPSSAASALANRLCQQALHSLHSGMGDADPAIDAALRADPDHVGARCLRAALLVMSGSDAAREPLARCLREAAVHGDAAVASERRHLAAAQAWLDGDAARALALYGQIAVDDPHDTLALRVAHQGDLQHGRTGMLRDRIAAALPHWRPGQSGRAHVLAMLAFGLAENGQCAQAETQARRALADEARHAGAMHALAHVYEMQDRSAEGIACLQDGCDWWSDSPSHAVHLWWHLALFHVERGELDAALRILERQLLALDQATPANCVDASALLWRLHLLGLDLAPAWACVADAWERIPLGAQRPFNEAHAMLAFVGAARWSSARRLTDMARDKAARLHDPHRVVLETALHVCEAAMAFGEGRHADASAWLQQLRHVAQRCGGSQAQCDLLQLTWIESAWRAGQTGLARRLLAERAVRRPRSLLNVRLGARIASLRPLSVPVARPRRRRAEDRALAARPA
jgi:hypothetical protein